MQIYQVYDPVSSETLTRKETLKGAQQYVAGLFTKNGGPPPVWREAWPGEWWALSQKDRPAEYIIFTETVN